MSISGDAHTKPISYLLGNANEWNILIMFLKKIYNSYTNVYFFNVEKVNFTHTKNEKHKIQQICSIIKNRIGVWN